MQGSQCLQTASRPPPNSRRRLSHRTPRLAVVFLPAILFFPGSARPSVLSSFAGNIGSLNARDGPVPAFSLAHAKNGRSLLTHTTLTSSTTTYLPSDAPLESSQTNRSGSSATTTVHVRIQDTKRGRGGPDAPREVPSLTSFNPRRHCCRCWRVVKIADKSVCDFSNPSCFLALSRVTLLSLPRPGFRTCVSNLSLPSRPPNRMRLSRIQ